MELKIFGNFEFLRFIYFYSYNEIWKDCLNLDMRFICFIYFLFISFNVILYDFFLMVCIKKKFYSIDFFIWDFLIVFNKFEIVRNF